MAIAFETPEGQAAIRALAAEADIVIENFKVGGLAKYGLDYASLKAVNPRLIYASITGFGQTGPYAERAGYDYIIQGMSGLMDITGEPEREPQKVGVAVVDLFTGVYTSTAILAALRQRDMTGPNQGQGCHIDMALYDCATAMLANQAMNYLASGKSPSRLGNAHPNIAPYQVFKVKDGHIIIAVGNDGQFQKFCAAIGAENAAHNEGLPDQCPARGKTAELQVELEPFLVKYTRTELLELLEGAGVPAGPINRIEDVFADPQIVHRGMKLELAGVDGSKVSGVASPIVINGLRMAADAPSPMLGSGKAGWQT
ncbi:MAG: CaiB/BaiF CoA-transferase family protein [Asticcacaulis sp.]